MRMGPRGIARGGCGGWMVTWMGLGTESNVNSTSTVP